jgi:hypothetical protein
MQTKTKIEITPEMKRWNAAVLLVDNLFGEDAERIESGLGLAQLLYSRGCVALGMELERNWREIGGK